MEVRPTPVIGVHSPLEAKQVEHLGGNFIWLSGYSISTSCFGLPDLDIADPDSKIEIITRISKSTNCATIVDLDSGMEDTDEFARYLSQLNQVKPHYVCIEDEPLPKNSALYKQEKPLISTYAFARRLEFVNAHIDSNIIARTNGIVRGLSAPEVVEKLKTVTQLPFVNAVALHGAEYSKILAVLSELKDIDTFLIVSLLSGDDIENANRENFAGLIFGHDMLFSAINSQTDVARSIIQRGTVMVNREKAKSLINRLVDHDQSGDLIEGEMILYYSRRANEYNDWYDRLDQYDKGEELNRLWHAEVSELEGFLKRFTKENIFEIASGTGRWTKILLEKNEVLPCDASTEMLQVMQEHCGVQGIQLDVFGDLPLELKNQFSMVFFGFFLSHVRSELIEQFMEFVSSSLKPNGKMLIFDSYYNSTELNCLSHSDDVQLRVLRSGETFRVVKHYYTAIELEEFAEKYLEDWQLDFTDNYFFALSGTLKG